MTHMTHHDAFCIEDSSVRACARAYGGENIGKVRHVRHASCASVHIARSWKASPRGFAGCPQGGRFVVRGADVLDWPVYPNLKG
jgi:hypothetical protein